MENACLSHRHGAPGKAMKGIGAESHFASLEVFVAFKSLNAGTIAVRGKSVFVDWNWKGINSIGMVYCHRETGVKEPRRTLSLSAACRRR